MMSLGRKLSPWFVCICLIASLTIQAFQVSAETHQWSTEIRGTYTYEIDTNTLGGPLSQADLFWEQLTTTTRQLDPENGAGLAALGTGSLDSISSCSGYQLTGQPIDASDAHNLMPAGTILCVRTHLGKFAKIHVDSYGTQYGSSMYNLFITVVYQDDGTPDFASSIQANSAITKIGSASNVLTSQPSTATAETLTPLNTGGLSFDYLTLSLFLGAIGLLLIAFVAAKRKKSQAEMRYCANCARQIPGSVRFCPYCASEQPHLP
jgi:hypothetical protein